MDEIIVSDASRFVRGDGDSGGPVRLLALFFIFNFVGIWQEEGVIHVDHFGRGVSYNYNRTSLTGKFV